MLLYLSEHNKYLKEETLVVKVKEKTIEVTEDDFATAASMAVVVMVKENPAQFLIHDELLKVISLTADLLFNHPNMIEKVKKEEGGKE